MRLVPLATSCALLAACFSKPPNLTGGNGDGGVDSAIDGPAIDPSAPALIAAGGNHACRIVTGGMVLCWGSHAYRQLGQRTVGFPGYTGIPELASSDGGWTSIAAGVQHTCGIRDQKVYCWGENNYRQSAPQIGPMVGIAITPVDLPDPAEQVFAGGFSSCAITTKHEAYCWGRLELHVDMFAAGQTYPIAPVRLGATTFRQIVLSDHHGCALADDGVAHCWGESEQNQTGRLEITDVTFAGVGPIASSKRFTSLAAGYEVTCGITTDAELACWGSSNQGKLGPPTDSGGDPFQLIEGTRDWKAVGVGYDHVCAVSGLDYSVYCYGENQTGALGRGDFSQDIDLGLKADTTFEVSQLALNHSYSCALSRDGTAMKCWGRNSKGELGNRRYSRKTIPTEAKLTIGGGEHVEQLIAGDEHTCALVGTTEFRAYCWGRNQYGQIGSTQTSHLVTEPAEAAPSGTNNYVKLATGEQHTCGIYGANVGVGIECWGTNSSYQLGSTLPAEPRFRVLPPGNSSMQWSDVAAGSRMTCGIHLGSLECWGAVPGQSNPNASRIPYPKLGGSWPWQSIAVGSGFAIGSAYDGTDYHFGGIGSASTRCAAGLLTTDSVNTSVEILRNLMGPNKPHVSAAQASGAHSCIHHGGASAVVSCFGDETLPQVGGALTCGTVNANSVDVGSGWAPASTTTPRMFAMGNQSCALDANNRMKCWGGNDNYELGQASGALPPQNAFDTATWPAAWTAIAGGRDHTCGIANGKVYCWGENQYGQIGDGSSWEPSPVASGAP